MSLWDDMRADAPEFLADFGREVVFRGKKIIAIIDHNAVNDALDVGGFTYKASYRVRFYLEEGGMLEKNPPDFGERMSIFDRIYSIDRVIYRPPSPWCDVYVVVYNQ